MQVNLLEIKDLEPPMGDTAGRHRIAFTRAIWTTPSPGEEEAPHRRIIHARVWQGHKPAVLTRIGVRKAHGYHKCGSIVDMDWVTSFRVLAWIDQQWIVLLEDDKLAAPAPDSIVWFDLPAVETTSVIMEVRKCGIDQWWPSWNLVSGAFVLEGETDPVPEPRNEKLLQVKDIQLDAVGHDLVAAHGRGEVRFRSDKLDVGFALNRAGFSFLGVDDSGRGNTESNLLRHAPGVFFQGPQLAMVDSPPTCMPALRNDVRGSTTVRGNTVSYDLTLGDIGLDYVLTWTIFSDRLELEIVRISSADIRAWKSNVWTIGMNSAAVPAHVIGAINHKGESGLMTGESWLHFPGMGSFRITSDSDEVIIRSDAVRPSDLTLLEIKLGEVPLDEGEYLIRAGEFRARVNFQLDRPAVHLRDGTPDEIRQAIEACVLTGLSYRADTATLSNNGASMHCPICMDNWAAVSIPAGQILPDLNAVDLLQASLERWLDGGPGYTSGGIVQNGIRHEAADEYLMAGAACLLGLGRFLQVSHDASWLNKYRNQIRDQILKMKKRDLDDDGLIESEYRTGTSGSGQWSTCWFDVVSYGWKDAFTNAILYRALVILSKQVDIVETADGQISLKVWAEQIRANYRSTFFNESTGWLAGWRCADDKLHDHAFLPPNGAAVVAGLLDPDDARQVIGRLWSESQNVGMPDALLGLPGNLWKIPDHDLADIIQGYPMGFYQNGGRTHSQARHFVAALFEVGMVDEAEELLARLCKGLSEGIVFGGSRSGLDWRYWDGRPCGYEGLLTDQFGVIGLALEKYARDDLE